MVVGDLEAEFSLSDCAAPLRAAQYRLTSQLADMTDGRADRDPPAESPT